MEMDLYEENVSSRIPPEIWVKIFAFVPEPRNLSKLRPVCKQWQAVIEENFDMKVRINDDQMDVASIFKFRRVVRCVVSNFRKDDLLVSPFNQIFWEPEILSSLILRGSITKPNFMLIAEQCQNVKELFLTGSLLTGDASLFVTRSDEETSILLKFMSRLQKLVLNVLQIVTSDNNTTSVNLNSLLNWPMNELKTLVLRLHFKNAEDEHSFLKLLEKYRSLESIEYTSRTDCGSLPLRPIIFNLPALCALNIKVKGMDSFKHWIPFIGAQSSIKHLKMVSQYFKLDLDRNFMNAIMKNSETLQSLELRNLSGWNKQVNLQFVGELCNLKELILHGDPEFNERPTLRNLGYLPESLDVLVLENFECQRQEFALIADRTLDLKTRKLVFKEG